MAEQQTYIRITEPKKWTWYNTEGRGSTGAYYSNKDQKYYGGGETQVQTFYLDGTDTDSEHLKETTFFTLKNGVHCDISYYIVPQGSTLSDGGFRMYGYVHYRDKDGNDIRPATSVNLFEAYQDTGTDISHVKYYYVSSHAQYQQDGTIPDTGYAGAGFNMFGKLYGRNYWENPNQRPLHSDMDYAEWITNWNSSDLGYCYNWEEVDNFFESIIEGGDGSIITPILPSEDTSEPGGGDGADPDYDPYGDPVDFADLPTGGSALATGFVKVYSPTANELQSLASELWSSSFVNTLEKIMNDPMEAMISLHAVPIGLVGSGTAGIKIGNYVSQVSAKYITAQYYTVNCGNISLPEHWASALDYSPYTNVDIFIPFVGVRPLQIDDVMGKVLTLKYNVDILTGSAVAMLKCGDSVLYTFNTQIHAEIPYTMSSYGRLVQSIVGIAGTAIGATAGGAGAIIGASVGGALGTAMTKHSDISRGGALGGSVGVMGDFTPYLIIHRPLQSLASGFASKKGYPSNIGATLSSLSGYTVVDKVHLTGIDCTDTERDEIHALLKDGVII